MVQAENPNGTSRNPAAQVGEGEPQPIVHSLKELIDLITGRNYDRDQPVEESGIAEMQPFPFLALVGQYEMKLALLLGLVNPGLGGVLLIGPRGTGKTTAVRSLLGLMPDVERSACFYGCMPEDVETGGMDAVCPDCARKYAEGKPLTVTSAVRLVELPLNSGLEDVTGRLDEHVVAHERFRLKRGILAQADRNVLYADEVNLLGDEIVNAILDAAAQGQYTVRRGPLSATYNARFTLIGSMNPEEGILRSQIMDRFGLRVLVHGLQDDQERKEAYDRSIHYRRQPIQLISQFAQETQIARQEVQAARERLPQVRLPDPVAAAGIALIRKLGIDSLRAEITLFEAAKAHAVIDSRSDVELNDIRAVAPMALRLRRSAFMTQYFDERAQEDREFDSTLNLVIPGDQ